MALAFSNLKRSLPGTRASVSGTVAFDNSYPTGGEPVTISQLGLSVLDTLTVMPSVGYTFEWNGSRTAPTIIAYRGDNANASPAPGVQVSNAVDLTAVNAAQFVATGY